jgi:hypothetical protein
MKIYSLTLFVFYFSSLESVGQSKRYNELVEIAKGQSGLVLYNKPSKIRINIWALRQYDERNTKPILSNSLLNDLIKATKNMDSTKWQTNEFKRTILVNNTDTILNAIKILNIWKIDDKVKRKKYRRLINKWINTDKQERALNYLSKPAMTENEEYGLILTDLTTHGLCCGGKLTLYKYESGQWKDIGVIYSWKH